MEFMYNRIDFLIKKSIIFLFLLSVPVSAQQFNIRTFTTKEGLSHNDVRAMAVDSSGFLWLATWDGLSRYDGYSFKNYYHRSDDTLSLPYFSIYNLLVDGANNLWLMTDHRKIFRYDRLNDTFIPVRKLDRQMPEYFNYLCKDESGYPWLVTSDSLIRFDFSKNKFDKYQLFDKSGSPYSTFPLGIYSVYASEKNKIWLVYQKTYEFERLNGNKFILKKEYDVETTLTERGRDYDYSNWYNMYYSNSGRRWIFSNEGLFLFDEGKGIFRQFRDQIPEKEFKGDGFLLWSWNDEGIYIYDSKEARLLHIPQEYCQIAKSILCQNKDLVWFSNTSMTGASLGISRVVFTPDYFKNYPLIAGKNDVPQVYTIAKDHNGRIWSGMRGRYPVVQITPENEVKKLDIPEYKTKFDHGAVRSIIPTDEGLWIGYFKELLLFYNFRTGKFTRHYSESVGFRPLALDKQGMLYLINRKNNIEYLARYSPELQKTIDLAATPYDYPAFKIFIDDKGIVWVGLNHSELLKYDPVSEKLESFNILPENFNIEDICQGDNDDLWVALLGAGVCNFNPSTGKTKSYTTSNGLSNNITYGVLKDKTGNIWVSTNSGISRINPRTGLIRSFGQNEGLNIIEFNSGASYKDENSEFFMGGMGGIAGFFPDSINLDELASIEQRIIINEIKVSGETRKFKRSVNRSDTIILNKGETNIQIFFSSSDFIHSDLTLYRYKLSRINDDWIETDSRNRNINYSNLGPGLYTLQLQATDRTGSWCPPKEIVLKIKPYYYQTLLFRIGVPLFFLLILAGMIFIYIRQLKQRESQKQNALRLQTLRGQMNPHFIFNSLNSINYFISNNDKLSANRYIADFSKLIRSILYNLNNDFITLEKEIESVEDYLKIEYLRFGDKFDYSLFVEEGIIKDQIKVSPGMVQPFVENAIWHGIRGLENRKGNIIVRFGFQNQKLVCVIEDDGIGRERAELMKSKNDQKKSKGISIVMERLKILNHLQNNNYQINISDLKVDNYETGTKVVIELPVERN
jgi:ligand-binding sensor domain-containing protein/anti-sigma regulatory factor (Ser/Thr protein kinase)